MSSKVKDPDIDGHTKDSTGHGPLMKKKMMAEAEGVTNLTDDGALILSEDLSYRLREIVQNSIEYMKHAKRRRLTTDDINDALRTSDMQPILGHGSPEPVTFKQVKDADIHFVEDLDLNVANIAFNSYKPKETVELGIKSFWYAIEGVSKISPVQNAAGKPVIVKKEKKELSDNMLCYYDYMVKAILGADEEAMKFALSDLKTNSKIVPLLPYFVNFVSNGVKTVSHDISQLTRLLHTVKALTNNSNLYLEPEPYLGLLVQSVMYCGLEPLAASINPLNDHWVLRDYAARLLGHIVKKWSVHNSALMQDTLKSLKEVICDLSRPFCSHYGAVMGLLALGTKAIEDVLLPQLQVYMPHLNNFMEDTSLNNALLRTDANKVYGAILLAAEYVMKNLLQHLDLQTPYPNGCPKSTILLPDPSSFQLVKVEPGASEHLWHSMQERFVAEIRKEHEEQERLEEERRRERERLEQEQRERERLEREQQKKAKAEKMEKQQKKYHQRHPEKFWQPVPTEDEAEDSDNANDNIDRMQNKKKYNNGAFFFLPTPYLLNLSAFFFSLFLKLLKESFLSF
ncbi:TAF6 [Acanthosepion pharaonis]|uniref:Histone H4 n=1 Tax=Acanthosepion pharaonis TaxID=158019 RepID=A0A812BMU6_ACAPH|nr:TAF6 [Sepia pharaonis]